MQLTCQRAAREGRRIHPVDRRIAVHHRIELRGKFAPRRPPVGLAAGETVGQKSVRTEPGNHVGARQLGELPDGANAHPPQQVGQIFPARPGEAGLGGQLPDGQPGQKCRILPRLDDAPGPGREHRGGQLIGDARLAFGAGRGHRVDQPFGGLLFRAEITGCAPDRHHQQARPQHLGSRHHLIHRRGHALEVAGIARRIGGDDMQLRAAGLRLTATQPAPHPDRSRRRRTGDDAVGQGDRDRVGGRQSCGGRGGHRRPIHAPERKNPGHRQPPAAIRGCPGIRRLLARVSSRTRPIRPRPGTAAPPEPTIS